MLNQVKIALGIFILLIVIIVSVYFVGKFAGKETPPKDVKLPKDADPDAGTYWNPGPVTDAIYNDIYSFGFRDVTPYENAIQLSNSKLAAVSNDWNKRYYSKDHETLRQAVENESLAFGSFSFRAIRDQLIERLKQIEQLQKK